MELLETIDIVKKFGGLRALDGVTMCVKEGEIAGLIGPNGSGKTTLFNVLSGVLPPDSGEVYFNGELISGLEPCEIFYKGLVRSFQTPQLFYRISVIDNMLLAARNQLGDSLTNLFFNRANYKNQEKKLRSKALEILELLGLDKASGELPTRLSGGQLKLLEIGRALMAEPKMLLLDEPAAGVSVVAAERIFEKLLELNRKFRVTLLIIEHRLELISKIVDKVFVMNRGRILAEGKPEEVFKMDKVIEAYLGEEVSI